VSGARTESPTATATHPTAGGQLTQWGVRYASGAYLTTVAADVVLVVVLTRHELRVGLG
jgi:hypothetical protein